MFNLSEIDQVMNVAFVENLLIAGLNSSTGKTWQQSINNLNFIPDFAIVRSISYCEIIPNNTDVNFFNFIVQSNLSGSQDILGTFNTFGTPSNLGAGITGTSGSVNNPQTIIKLCKPIQNATFTILAPSTTQDGAFISASTIAGVLTGQLIIVMDFIKLKSKA